MSIRIIFYLSCLLNAIVFSSCIFQHDQDHTAAKAALLPTEQIRIHKVLYPGETISMISFWYTGSAKNSSLLESYNGQIKDGAITIGSIVRIPQDVMIRNDQMTGLFVTQQKSKSEKNRKPSSKSTSKETPTPMPTFTIETTPEPEVSIAVEETFTPTVAPTPTEEPQEANQDKLIENLIP